MLIAENKRSKFSSLFREFLDAYPSSKEGQAHRELYSETRTTARNNYEEIATAYAKGEDITDLVLLKLLPYVDTPKNRTRGAWIHWAPSINGDLRKWYERAHWATPEQWPNIATSVWAFVHQCVETPEQVENACREFSDYANKGFQTGTLTPILNALRPDKFALINNKSRNTINYLTDSKFGQNLSYYPDINVVAFELIEELQEFLDQPRLAVTSLDLFDMFCHWLVAVHKFKFQGIDYWKIAPGEKAWHWDECREGGFITIGWDELGDLTEIDRSSFELRRNELAKEHGWTHEGIEQVWTFAKDIHEDDQIIANRGISELLGIGIVTGPYYFVPGERHGHRLPVEWIDTTLRRIKEGGWRKTLIKLTQSKFEKLQDAPVIDDATTQLAEPFSLLFADRDEAEWAFDFLERSMDLLGIKGPDDKRCALTLPKDEKGNLLRFNFVKDLTVDFRSAALNGTPAIYLAFQPVDFLEQYLHGGNFSAFKEPVKVYGLPYDIVRNMTPQMEQHYEKSFRYIGEVKAKATGSPFRHAHQKQVMDAIFDHEKRKALLTHGLLTEEGMVDDDGNPASPFFRSTFELLEELHHTPKASYYLENKQAFVEKVELPFQRIMQKVAAQFPNSILDVMETEKKIFGRFLKNDFGQGGAWAFYWGAFYPKGSKRSQDAQLIVWMNYEYMQFGFYIGEYGSQQRRRFLDNCRLHKVQLGSVLETLAADHFLYGRHSELPIKPDGSVGRPNATLQDWQNFLEDPDQLNCDVSVALPRDMLLQLCEDELVERIAAVHKQLFPLVLLCISDDPMTAIADYLGVDMEDELEDPPQPYTLAECVAETGIDETTLTEWLEAIERKGQAILYGPPGTGKTYVGERLARLLVADGGGITELVQFHPAYAYEDFIQGIRPQTSAEGQLIYPTVPGRFLEFCRKAEKHSGICVLILDEINRANLSRVFGELMYLLEYRDRDIPLAGGGRLRIPKNVRIIGTMNTADRSIALVDHALRRRFLFIALSPDMEVLRRFHQGDEEAFPVEKLIQVLERLNQRIQDRNYAVGTSYFLRKNLRGSISTIWRMEIEPYLEEYFFAQPDRIEEFRWKKVSVDLGL